MTRFERAFYADPDGDLDAIEDPFLRHGLTLVVDGLDAGIRAFVLKEAPPDDLIRAITLASDGGLYVDPMLVEQVWRDFDAYRALP